MLMLLNEHILPRLTENDENKVFYLKLKADYYRYLAEICMDKEYMNYAEQAQTEYKNAWDISKSLQMHNITRLSLALNFSVFLYEIKNNRDEAKKLAKFAFDESMKTIEEINKTNSTETILLIKLLNENIILWNIEVENTEDTAENEEFFKRKAQEFKIDQMLA